MTERVFHPCLKVTVLMMLIKTLNRRMLWRTVSITYDLTNPAVQIDSSH